MKVTYLLLWVGDKGREVRNSWTDLDADEPPEDPKKLKTLYDRYKAHVQPKLNPIFARFKFNNEIQGSSTVEQFITRLRLLAVDCTFKDPGDMIRDRIVFGTSSDKVREKLINEGEKLTLDKAIQIAQSYEYSQHQLKSMGSQLDQVNSIRKASISRHPVKKRTDPGSHPGPDAHAEGATVITVRRTRVDIRNVSSVVTNIPEQRSVRLKAKSVKTVKDTIILPRNVDIKRLMMYKLSQSLNM